MKDKTYCKEMLQSISEMPESQKLIQLLQKDGGKVLESAIQHLRSGSPEKAIELLEPMMRSGNSQDLLRQIKNKIG